MNFVQPPHMVVIGDNGFHLHQIRFHFCDFFGICTCIQIRNTRVQCAGKAFINIGNVRYINQRPFCPGFQHHTTGIRKIRRHIINTRCQCARHRRVFATGRHICICQNCRGRVVKIFCVFCHKTFTELQTLFRFHIRNITNNIVYNTQIICAHCGVIFAFGQHTNFAVCARNIFCQCNQIIISRATNIIVTNIVFWHCLIPPVLQILSRYILSQNPFQKK